MNFASISTAFQTTPTNTEDINMTGDRLITRALQGALLVLLVTEGFASAQPSGRLIFFGDSLSDSGNFFAATGEGTKPPFEVIPSAPYSIGGNHFSDGATWTEYLATRIGANPSAHPAFVNPGQFTNYAVGRARARAGAPIFPFFDLTMQVGRFLTDFGFVAPSDATYVIWIGTNDARDAFAAGGDPAIIGAALSAIANNIGLLVQRGAKTIIVLNVPNLGILPAVNSIPGLPALATAFTLAYNQQLSNTLDGLEPGIIAVGGQLIRVDTFTLLNAVVLNPGAWRLANVTDSCLRFGVRRRFRCGNPRSYLFWDGAHPTTAGHRLLSDAVAPRWACRERGPR